jgi:hypothetical protein
LVGAGGVGGIVRAGFFVNMKNSATFPSYTAIW